MSDTNAEFIAELKTEMRTGITGAIKELQKLLDTLERLEPPQNQVKPSSARAAREKLRAALAAEAAGKPKEADKIASEGLMILDHRVSGIEESLKTWGFNGVPKKGEIPKDDSWMGFIHRTTVRHETLLNGDGTTPGVIKDLTDTKKEVGEAKAKADEADKTAKEAKQHVDDHDKRITALEKGQFDWHQARWAALITFVIVLLILTSVVKAAFFGALFGAIAVAVFIGALFGTFDSTSKKGEK